MQITLTQQCNTTSSAAVKNNNEILTKSVTGSLILTVTKETHLKNVPENFTIFNFFHW